jgi:two-component system sensor histidine kinase UhpB
LECFFEAGTILMWKTWSLRTRLCIFLCTMFLAALIAGLVLLRVFAAEQLADENEPAGSSSILIAVRSTRRWPRRPIRKRRSLHSWTN